MPLYVSTAKTIISAVSKYRKSKKQGDYPSKQFLIAISF